MELENGLATLWDASQKEMEDNIRDVMIQFGLHLGQIRILQYKSPINKEIVVDLKNRKIRIERTLKLDEDGSKIVEIAQVNKDMDKSVFLKLIEIDKPRLEWEWDGEKHVVRYNEKYNLIELRLKKEVVLSEINSFWILHITGVYSEAIWEQDFKESDLIAVKRYAEAKLLEVSDRILDIINRSNGRN